MSPLSRIATPANQQSLTLNIVELSSVLSEACWLKMPWWNGVFCKKWCLVFCLHNTLNCTISPQGISPFSIKNGWLTFRNIESLQYSADFTWHLWMLRQFFKKSLSFHCLLSTVFCFVLVWFLYYTRFQNLSVSLSHS